MSTTSKLLLMILGSKFRKGRVGDKPCWFHTMSMRLESALYPHPRSATARWANGLAGVYVSGRTSHCLLSSQFSSTQSRASSHGLPSRATGILTRLTRCSTVQRSCQDHSGHCVPSTMLLYWLEQVTSPA